eukprot:3230357-Rhodomonas_salina.4
MSKPSLPQVVRSEPGANSAATCAEVPEVWHQVHVSFGADVHSAAIQASTLALTQTAPNSPAIDAAKADNSEWTTGKKVLMVASTIVLDLHRAMLSGP